jgi:NADH/F420H2 dehydrogenase subunit C
VDLARRPVPEPVPQSGQPAGRPSLTAFNRDHINELLSQLAALDTLVGQPVPKTRMNGGAVGIELARERLLPAVQALRDQLGFNLLACVIGVDMIDHVQSLYHLRNLEQNWLVQLRVKLPLDDPAVDSLVSLYASANWLEREQYDLMGIVYRGHPDLRRILLDDEFVGYPLRKSFRPTPMTMHDRATTQVDAERAVSGEQQRRQERIVPKHFGQGDQERIHPGKPTFGSAAVYLETGQGLLPGDVQGEYVAEHGYDVDTSDIGPVMKPGRG